MNKLCFPSLQCENVLVLVQNCQVMDSAMCYCRYQKSQYLSSFHQCPQTSITLQFQSQVGAKSSVIDFKNSKSLNLKTIITKQNYDLTTTKTYVMYICTK